MCCTRPSLNIMTKCNFANLKNAAILVIVCSFVACVWICEPLLAQELTLVDEYFPRRSSFFTVIHWSVVSAYSSSKLESNRGLSGSECQMLISVLRCPRYWDVDYSWCQKSSCADPIKHLDVHSKFCWRMCSKFCFSDSKPFLGEFSLPINKIQCNEC